MEHEKPCRYCAFNLDDGDIYEVLSKHPDYAEYSDVEIRKFCRDYGWTPEKKTRFSKITIIQFNDKQPQIEVCPKCYGIWPIDLDLPKIYYTEKKLPKE